MEGMKVRLDERLGPVESDPNSFGPNGEGRNKDDGDWEIQDCLAQWWRPNFETFMVSRTTESCLHWIALLDCRCVRTLFANDCHLNDITVSLCTTTHYQAERMQEALPGHHPSHQ